MPASDTIDANHLTDYIMEADYVYKSPSTDLFEARFRKN